MSMRTKRIHSVAYLAAVLSLKRRDLCDITLVANGAVTLHKIADRFKHRAVREAGVDLSVGKLARHRREEDADRVTANTIVRQYNAMLSDFQHDDEGYWFDIEWSAHSFRIVAE